MIAYSITQQIKQSLVDENYLNGMKESFTLLRKTSNTLTADLAKSYFETLQKYSQMTRGSLNQFLSTPIKSDEEEIRRTIKDNFEQFAEQYADMLNTGIEHSWQSRFLLEQSLLVGNDKNTRKLFQNGKKFLVQSRILAGKIPSAVFESVFVFPSPQGLAHLNNVIALLPDGEFEYFTSSVARNASLDEIVHEAGTKLLTSVKSGTDAGKEIKPQIAQWEITLYPKFNHLNLVDFESKCANLFTRITSEFNIQHIALWKRLLNLGSGALYSIRLTTIPDIQMVAEIIRWFTDKADSDLRTAFISNGALVVKEILW